MEQRQDSKEEKDVRGTIPGQRTQGATVRSAARATGQPVTRLSGKGTAMVTHYPGLRVKEFEDKKTEETRKVQLVEEVTGEIVKMLNHLAHL